MSRTQLAVWDFTYSAEHTTKEILEKFLRTHCKKWTFQKESGDETGYVHYQGRISLNVRRRIGECIKLWQTEGLEKVRITITSNTNRDNDFYVIKPDGRLEGPWRDTDIDEANIPWDLEDIKEPYPWQQYVLEDRKTKRDINVIVDEIGHIGKSSLAKYMVWNKKGMFLPLFESHKELVGAVCDMPEQQLYVLDCPRSIDITKANQLWGAIEAIKNGMVYDGRYHFRYKIFGCPEVWVFMNAVPDDTLMSRDRWKFWKVEGKELVPYEKEDNKSRDRD